MADQPGQSCLVSALQGWIASQISSFGLTAVTALSFIPLSLYPLHLSRSLTSPCESARSQCVFRCKIVFWVSISDIVLLIQLTGRACTNWNNSCSNYAEITGQLESLHIILNRLLLRGSLCVFLLSERFWCICTRELLSGQLAPPPYLCGV